jgi:type III secretory pathway component EscV
MLLVRYLSIWSHNSILLVIVYVAVIIIILPHPTFNLSKYMACDLTIVDFIFLGTMCIYPLGFSSILI